MTYQERCLTFKSLFKCYLAGEGEGGFGGGANGFEAELSWVVLFVCFFEYMKNNANKILPTSFSTAAFRSLETYLSTMLQGVEQLIKSLIFNWGSNQSESWKLGCVCISSQPPLHTHTYAHIPACLVNMTILYCIADGGRASVVETLVLWPTQVSCHHLLGCFSNCNSNNSGEVKSADVEILFFSRFFWMWKYCFHFIGAKLSEKASPKFCESTWHFLTPNDCMWDLFPSTFQTCLGVQVQLNCVSSSFWLIWDLLFWPFE